MAQNPRTLKFWDEFYKHEVKTEGGDHAREWILCPTTELLNVILSRCKTLAELKFSGDGKENGNKRIRKKPVAILEIGCGTSTLSKDLFLMWKMQRSSEKQDDIGYKSSCLDFFPCILATDVSAPGIEHVRQRDSDLLQEFPWKTVGDGSPAGPSLEYATLDVVEPTPLDIQLLIRRGPFDLILDKGCLDTFLFRSRSRGDSSAENPLVDRVLKNIHSWLRPGSGIYMAMTPRSKIRPLRDFVGFEKMERTTFSSHEVKAGALEGEVTAEYYYAHVAHARLGYNPSIIIDVSRNVLLLKEDTDTCPKCQQTFLDFRGRQSVATRGARTWSREWTGHKQHCKGTKCC